MPSGTSLYNALLMLLHLKSVYPLGDMYTLMSYTGKATSQWSHSYYIGTHRRLYGDIFQRELWTSVGTAHSEKILNARRNAINSWSGNGIFPLFYTKHVLFGTSRFWNNACHAFMRWILWWTLWTNHNHKSRNKVRDGGLFLLFDLTYRKLNVH